MEWLILGYSVICLYQCSSEKFSTGKPWSNALFLFHYKPSEFCFGQATFQFIIDVGNEFAKSVVIYSLFGQSDAKSWSICWFSFIGRLEPKSCIYFSCCYCCKGTANAAIMAVLGFPIIIPQIVLLMKLSNAAFAPLLTISPTTVLLLIALDIMVILLAVILFPFLWKD